MQSHRLFEIIYLLMDKKQITAAELADHFEVSVRTIYRDVERLSLSGVPIYTTIGKNGGISLMEDYVLNKSILTDTEQNEILMALQSISAVEYPNPDNALKKLSTLFNKNNQSWIEVDFTSWGSGIQDRVRFDLLRSAILNRQQLTFHYFGSDGKETIRKVEPLRMLFKGQNWYLQAFCLTRQDFRLFKLFRIHSPKTTGLTFEPRECPVFVENIVYKTITIKLQLSQNLRYRVYDEFKPEQITVLPDGRFEILFEAPLDNWINSYILTFGADAVVISPSSLRQSVKNTLLKTLENY